MTRTTAAFLLVLAAGCGSDQAGPGPTPTNFSVINGAGAGGTVKVYLDGVFAADVAAGERGAKLSADPGPHQVELRRADGSGSVGRQVILQADMPMTVVAWDSLGFLSPAVLEDSNSVVAPGSSKLRVAHFAGSAGRIDIWRTQPDYGTPIRIMFPFNYRDISPFVESTPGKGTRSPSNSSNCCGNGRCSAASTCSSARGRSRRRGGRSWRSRPAR